MRYLTTQATAATRAARMRALARLLVELTPRDGTWESAESGPYSVVAFIVTVQVLENIEKIKVGRVMVARRMAQ